MKQCILSLLICVTYFTGIAQEETKVAPYLKYPGFPPIQLVQLDNKPLTKKDIHANQPSLLFYFSPECEHCQHQVTDMLKKMDALKKVQIVMVTHQPAEMLQRFYTDYGLNKYKNIRVARDTKFLLPPFYNIKSLPYQALYNKKGNLITTYEGNVKIETLAKAYGTK
ncbi:MAG TPA: redoxin domain-containing protein [Flavitalea sp.]|nr:redoxin domain-containing protein [Flavitalea sp.]